MKICVSVGSISAESCRKILSEERLVELRLDLLDIEELLADLIHGAKAKIISTFRVTPKSSDDHRKRIIRRTIDAGTSYIDIDRADTAAGWSDVIAYAKSKACKVIVSCHYFEHTPSREVLLKDMEECFECGADIAKIASTVNQKSDNAVLLGLLADPRPLIVTGMGTEGRLVRVLSPLLGGEFTYASPDSGIATAPGQVTVSELRSVYKVLRGALGEVA